MSETRSRRDVLRGAAGVALVVAGVAGCRRRTALPVACVESPGLSPEDTQARKTLGYAELATNGGEDVHSRLPAANSSPRPTRGVCGAIPQGAQRAHPPAWNVQGLCREGELTGRGDLREVARAQPAIGPPRVHAPIFPTPASWRRGSRSSRGPKSPSTTTGLPPKASSSSRSRSTSSLSRSRRLARPRSGRRRRGG